MQLFREDKDAWLVPVMCGMVHNLRDVARQADAETRRGGKSSDALDNCGTLMQSCFRTALQATGEHLVPDAEYQSAQTCGMPTTCSPFRPYIASQGIY